MRSLIAAFFSFVLSLTSLTPTPLHAEAASPLRLATFRCDVTPPIGGHPIIWTTPLKTIEDPLLAKGIILDDTKHRYVLCAIDWCGLCNSSYDLFRKKIADAANTPVTHVAVHTLHQHTAPYTDGDAQKLLTQFADTPQYVDFKFLDDVTDRLADAVEKSLKNLKPFDHLGIGQAKVQRVAATRRVKTKDGKIRIRWSACTDPELRAMPEGYIDPMIKTVTLANGQKPLVRLHYYATHPQSFYGDARASKDFVGFARERLEKNENVFQIYFTGCAGDVTAGKYNDRSRQARDELTDHLYQGMQAAVAATRLAPAKRLQWRTTPLSLPLRTDAGHTVAENLAGIKNPESNLSTRIRAATRLAFANRIKRPIELTLLTIGRTHIVSLPGECMIDFQLFAQSLKPQDFVAVAAYGDCAPGYICTEIAFSEGGYEPTASRAGKKSEHVLKAAIRKLLEM